MSELDQKSKMIRQTLKQAVDKNELKRRQVNENITMAESIIDTVEVDKVETSINDVVSSTKLNYIALPIFVPGDLTLNTVGMLKIESTKEKKVFVNNIQLLLFMYKLFPPALMVTCG
jgi:hypothetical protein